MNDDRQGGPRLPERAINRRRLLEAAGFAAAAGTAGAAAAQPGPLPITAGGRMSIDRDMTVSTPLILAPGTVVDIARGVTLRITGDFAAPIAPVFHGPGRVDLNHSRVLHVHPEWWGARADDPAADCAPAIEAALAAHPSVRLGLGDYHLARTLVVTRSGARLWGMVDRAIPGERATRLVLRSASGAVVRVGTIDQPPGVNDFCRGVDLRWIALARTERPAQDSVGLVGRFLLHCHFEGLDSLEHATGFRWLGTVRSLVRDCRALRTRAGGDTGRWVGFHLDGGTTIGLAGGNASLSLELCNATVGGRPKLESAVGLLLDGAFADAFVSDFETSEVAVGVRAGGPLPAARQRSGQANLHLTRLVIDQCADTGIELTALGPWAAVEITDPYVAVAPGALAAIRLADCVGQVSIAGGQLIGWVDGTQGGNALGLYVTNTSGLDVHGLKIVDHRRPVGIGRSSTIALQLSINNPGVVTSQAAIWLRDCRGVVLAPMVRGKAAAFPNLLAVLGPRSGEIDAQLTGMAPDAIAGGSPNAIAIVEGAPGSAVSLRHGIGR